MSLDVDEFVWVRDDQNWTTDPDVVAGKLCRWGASPHHRSCRRPAVAALRRSNGWWAYCAEHLYGRRFRDGVVEIRVSIASPIADRARARGEL